LGWLSGWSYRRPITIDNTQCPDDLQDYQVLVIVDTATLISEGKLRSDAGDLRFTDEDGETLLSYWVEGPINDPATKVWVKVPFIPGSGTKTIYMYYGNPDATSESDPEATMELFDDFLGDSLDTSKWGTGSAGSGANITVSNSVLSIRHPAGAWGAAWVYSLADFGPGHLVAAKIVAQGNNADKGLVGHFEDAGGEVTDNAAAWSQHDGGNVQAYKREAGTGTTVYDMGSPDMLGWWAVGLASDGKLRYFKNHESIATSTHSSPSTMVKVRLQAGAGSDGGNGGKDFDYVFVKKYVDPEPSASVGSEQTAKKPTVLTLQVTPL